jgi:hypothetical protein
VHRGAQRPSGRIVHGRECPRGYEWKESAAGHSLSFWSARRILRSPHSISPGGRRRKRWPIRISHERTIIGSARMAAMSASSSPVTALSRRDRVATIDSLSKPDSPSPTFYGKTAAPGRGSQQRLRMRSLRRGKFTPRRRSAAKKKRNRGRPVLSLQERLRQVASLARAKADGLPPGQERDRLIQTAVSNDAAATIDRWLASPELRSPR